MIKYFKNLFYKWKYRNSVAQKTVYVVVRKPDELSEFIKMYSIHMTAEGAMKARRKLMQSWQDNDIQVQRHGLWSK